MEVVAEASTITPVLKLSYHTIDVQLGGEEGVHFGRVREQLGHDEEVWVLIPSDLKEVLADMNRSTVGIVEPEPCKN